MAKSKSKPTATTPSKKNGDGGRVTKPSTKVEKTKAAAKAVVSAATTAAAAAGEKARKVLHESTKPNKKKEESEEEDSSEEEEDSSFEEDSSSDSSSSSEEESSAEETKVDKVHPAAAKADSSDESEGDSDEESSEDEAPKKVAPAKKANGAKAPAKAAKKEESSSEEDSDEDSNEESSEEEAPKKAAKPNGAAKPAAKAKKDESSDEDEDSSDEESSEEEDSDEEEDSSEEEDEEDEEEAKPAAGQKRKEAPSSATETPNKRPKPESSGSVSIFVGNLSWNIDQEWLASIFEEIGGVVSARIITDRDTGRPKGFGYVDFETPEQAQKALELKGTDVDGRPINIDMAQAKSNDTPKSDRAQRFGDKISEPSATLFVGNLSFNSSQDTLYDLFGQAGELVSVRIPTDKETGQVKGFAYVEFGDVETAKKAMNEYQGHYLDNRALRLDFSTPRDNSGGGGGFGGRGGGRGGRGGDRGGRGGGRGGFGGRGGGGRGGGRGGLGFRGGRGGGPSFQGKKTTF